VKRWIFTILLFLLVGVLANIAVAWGCALWRVAPILASNISEAASGESYFEGGIWLVQYARRAGIAYVSSQYRSPWPQTPSLAPEDPSAAIPKWSRIMPPTLEGRHRVATCEVDRACGWPWLSMRGGWDTDLDAPAGKRHMPVAGVLVKAPADIGLGGRVLPLHVLWSGFLGNTLAYAVASWLLLWFLAGRAKATRRAFRVKRGRCPSCGYDLRGELEAGCPECGWRRETAESGAKARAE